MTARPDAGPYTEAVYGDLPELYRDADAAQADGTSNYPLLRYLSTLLDQLTPLATYVDRFTYLPLDDRAEQPTSSPFGLPDPPQRFGTGDYGTGDYGDVDTADLVDPMGADAGWLPWLAQLLGVDLTGLTVDEQREKLLAPADAWAHGTPGAIASAVRAALPPGNSGYVDVVPHFQGDTFTIGIVTKAADTAGATTFDELKAVAPTWGDLKALGSYGAAEAYGVLAAAYAERPAGYQLAHALFETYTPPP